ncbi:DUF4097 family beta strand repeat-containing protein [Glycomyces buryatensis]|nr:DUF4097 family beta strand repeat-containing protein [Glycomyces buryatensis]
MTGPCQRPGSKYSHARNAAGEPGCETPNRFQRINQTTVISASNPVTVVLEVGVGNIQITASDRTDVIVEVLPTDASKKTDVETAENTVVEHVDGEVRLATPPRPKMSTKLRSVDITIQVPTGSNVRGQSAMGGFRTEGQLGSCDFSSSAGDITVDRVATAALQTSMGDIQVGQVADTASFHTASGNVRVAEAVSGVVKVSLQQGNIDVGVSKDSAVKLTTSTMHGKVGNSLSAEHDGREVTETVELDLRVMSGNIEVHRSN